MIITYIGKQKILEYFLETHDLLLHDVDIFELENILNQKDATGPDEDELWEAGTGGCRE